MEPLQQAHIPVCLVDKVRGQTLATVGTATLTLISFQPLAGTICTNGTNTFSVPHGRLVISMVFRQQDSRQSYNEFYIRSHISRHIFLYVSLHRQRMQYQLQAPPTLTVNAVPSITTQPVGGTICTGGTLSVAASGVFPSYLCRIGSGSISNATNTTYAVTTSGSYYCVVSSTGNGCTSATSNTATLIVKCRSFHHKLPVGGGRVLAQEVLST